MTRNEVIMRAVTGQLTWIEAAEICGVTPRQMRRLKQRYEQRGYDGLVDGRGGRPRRRRIPLETLRELCRLKGEQYPDFSVQHFWEKATEVHGLRLSYTWAKLALQAAGLAAQAPGRGRYRRRRERRPLRGMLLHLDASTHPWLPELPPHDLVVVQDDADSRVLYAQFVAEEGTLSTFAALRHVLIHYGRFGALYTDRASHFGRTAVAGQAPTPSGQVSRALKALGIRQIFAHSPQARGRSERTFQTFQGRLPQELRAAGLTDYAAANRYLVQHFVPDFNRRFSVAPANPASAFVPLVGIDLELLLSVQHERTVGNDSTVSLDGLVLQLPRTPHRLHYVRCPVLVHELPDGTRAISYQGQLLARYSATGQLLSPPAPPRRAGRGTARLALRARRPAPRPAPSTDQPSGHL